MSIIKSHHIVDAQALSESEKALSILRDIRQKNASFWSKNKVSYALKTLENAFSGVPAYRDFLKKKKISLSGVKTWDDFQKLPIVSKDNYLKKYPLNEISSQHESRGPLVFTSTSGSTGDPVYFSRSHEIDWQSSVIHQHFFSTGSFNKDKPTLVIVCFGMGVWIGGLITYQAFELFARRNNSPISILTPGINKEEIFKALKQLAPYYPQIILAGYPPFLKDILDEAHGRGINFKKHNVKLLFAAEAFTEKFRDHVCKLAGIKNPLVDTMNIYGSADIGTMAFETPVSILVRRLAMEKPQLFESLFGKIAKTPTLAQYIPSFTTFEAPKGEIVLTGNSSIPLVRYSIGDHGGVLTFNQIVEKCAAHGVSLLKEAKKAGIEKQLYQLPFVYVYERMDFATTIYGLQVYPETIKEVLIEKPFEKTLTGKLTLVTRFDKNQDQYIEINLELQKNKDMSAVMKNQLLKRIIKNLRKNNSEFRELSDYLKDRAYPKLVFWPAEDPLYFKSGIKQKWVKKG